MAAAPKNSPDLKQAPPPAIEPAPPSIVDETREALTLMNSLEFKNGAIMKAIPAIMAEMEAVAKTKTNTTPGQNFKFRGIDDVYNALQKVMAKHEVFSVPKILHRERKPIVSRSGTPGVHAIYQYRFRFFCGDGSWVDVFADGEGQDYGDKVTNKCASIAHKYAMLQVFSIPTEDLVDPDAESPGHDRAPESRPPANKAKPPAAKPASAPAAKPSRTKKQWDDHFMNFGWTDVQAQKYLDTKLGAKNGKASPAMMDKLWVVIQTTPPEDALGAFDASDDPA